MKILCIGNSFSDDATRYLYPIAQAADEPLRLYNLFIGGCPLSQHYRLMRSGEAQYALRLNEINTGLYISLRQALAAEDWDVVTLQQVSHLAPRYETYQPYLKALAAYARSFVPKAKLYLHQTWAYEQGSRRLTEELGYREQRDMFLDVQAAYEQAARDIRAEGILPSGEMLQCLLAQGISPVHRDTFHAELGIGRYALGALWFEVLTGKSVVGNSFRKLDAPAPEETILRVQRLAHGLAARYR